MSDLELGKQRALVLKLSLGETECLGRYHATYLADDIHKLLSDGAEVFGNPDADISQDEPGNDARGFGRPSPGDTHSALLIGIKPLKVETREERMEQLIKDLAGHDKFRQGPSKMVSLNPDYWIDRAKALLEEKP